MDVNRVVDHLPMGRVISKGKIKLSAKRDHYRYSLWDGHEKVYIGQTTDPESRENAHGQDKEFDRMQVEGPAVSRETALEWEQEAIDTYRRGHGGEPPKYNE